MYAVRCFAGAVASALSTALPCTYAEYAGNATLYFVLKLVDPLSTSTFYGCGKAHSQIHVKQAHHRL
jgi:hypothetical protein